MNILFLLNILSVFCTAKNRCPININFTSASDTTIVARIIEFDSIFENSNYHRAGVKFYYGIHHLKVVSMDISNSNKIVDTLILAYVYNKQNEYQLYKRNFDLKVDRSYIFDIHLFKPCQSDFPRLQGICSDDGIFFYPESNKMISKYSTINRIIFATEYRE